MRQSTKAILMIKLKKWESFRFKGASLRFWPSTKLGVHKVVEWDHELMIDNVSIHTQAQISVSGMQIAAVKYDKDSQQITIDYTVNLSSPVDSIPLYIDTSGKKNE